LHWFKETCNGLGLVVEVKKKIHESKGIQKVELFDTNYGKMLVLDGKIQVIESFEFYYHEMLVHVPMFIHNNPEKILLIGGGDGYSLGEILKHEPNEVLVVEIDKNVIDISGKYFGTGKFFSDKRVTVVFQDGAEFVKECREKFDVIIVDGTDPSPASKTLFSKEFFENCHRLSDIFCTQSQSPVFQINYLKDILRRSKNLSNRKLYLGYVPMYPLGLWSYLVASKFGYPNLEEIKSRFTERKIRTRYYNPEIHLASFALPEWLKREISSLI